MSQDTPIQNAEANAELPTGSEDEAAAAFAANQPEQADTEAAPADESTETEEPEAVEAEPEEAEEGGELVKVTLGGKEYEVPPEVEKAILRQADYSRKMNEVGAQEKAYKERLQAVEALAEGSEKRAEALAEVRSIDERIKQYEGIDWARARQENPSQAALAAIELLSLRDQRKEAVQSAANAARELTEGRNRLMAEKRNEMDAALKKELKGWGEELGTKLTKYALDSKVQLDTLQNLTDPAIVIALEKARQWDALQSAKGTVKAKAADAPPVAKPGVPRQSNPKSEVMTKHRKEGSLSTTADAFMATMR